MHTTRTDTQDVAKVASGVLKHKLFAIKEGRKHSWFPNLQTNPVWNWKVDKTKEWIENKRKEFMKYSGTAREENESEPDESENELELQLT